MMEVLEKAFIDTQFDLEHYDFVYHSEWYKLENEDELEIHQHRANQSIIFHVWNENDSTIFNLPYEKFKQMSFKEFERFYYETIFYNARPHEEYYNFCLSDDEIKKRQQWF